MIREILNFSKKRNDRSEREDERRKDRQNRQKHRESKNEQRKLMKKFQPPEIQNFHRGSKNFRTEKK